MVHVTASAKTTTPKSLRALLSLVLLGVSLIIIFGYTAHGLLEGFNNRGFATYKNSRFKFSLDYPRSSPLKEEADYRGKDKGVMLSKNWNATEGSYDSLGYNDGGGVRYISADFKLQETDYPLYKSKDEYFASRKDFVAREIARDEAEVDGPKTKIVGDAKEVTVSKKPALQLTVERTFIESTSRSIELYIYDEAYIFEVFISYKEGSMANSQIQKIIESIKLP